MDTKTTTADLTERDHVWLDGQWMEVVAVGRDHVTVQETVGCRAYIDVPATTATTWKVQGR